MNKAILVGNVGQDPELRFTQSGNAVLTLRVATNERFKDSSGEWKDRTEWHTVVVWGKRAEGLNKILSKGRSVAVEGRIQTRKWEDKQGGTRYSTEVVAFDVDPIGKGDGGGGRGGSADGDDFGGGGGFEDDSIPF